MGAIREFTEEDLADIEQRVLSAHAMLGTSVTTCDLIGAADAEESYSSLWKMLLGSQTERGLLKTARNASEIRSLEPYLTSTFVGRETAKGFVDARGRVSVWTPGRTKGGLQRALLAQTNTLQKVADTLSFSVKMHWFPEIMTTLGLFTDNRNLPRYQQLQRSALSAQVYDELEDQLELAFSQLTTAFYSKGKIAPQLAAKIYGTLSSPSTLDALTCGLGSYASWKMAQNYSYHQLLTELTLGKVAARSLHSLSQQKVPFSHAGNEVASTKLLTLAQSPKRTYRDLEAAAQEIVQSRGVQPVYDAMESIRERERPIMQNALEF